MLKLNLQHTRDTEYAKARYAKAEHAKARYGDVLQRLNMQS